MYVSTLRNYIRAMGGELKITVVFPNGVVDISQFQDVEEQKKSGGRRVRLNPPSSFFKFLISSFSFPYLAPPNSDAWAHPPPYYSIRNALKVYFAET